MTDGLNFQNKRYILREAITNNKGIATTKEVAIYYGE